MILREMLLLSRPPLGLGLLIRVALVALKAGLSLVHLRSKGHHTSTTPLYCHQWSQRWPSLKSHRVWEQDKRPSWLAVWRGVKDKPITYGYKRTSHSLNSLIWADGLNMHVNVSERYSKCNTHKEWMVIHVLTISTLNCFFFFLFTLHMCFSPLCY